VSSLSLDAFPLPDFLLVLSLEKEVGSMDGAIRSVGHVHGSFPTKIHCYATKREEVCQPHWSRGANTIAVVYVVQA
jgi:hypothetical protein